MIVLNVAIKHASYHEKEKVIKNIDFTVKRGELIGLIGPNGAGKSSTIKSIIGLMEHVEGSIDIFGGDNNISFIPEKPILYENLTLWEHLQFAAAIIGMEESVFIDKTNRLLAKFRLEHEKHHFPIAFSKGMQQKVMLILGFLSSPDVYLVDEPFIGLDPHGVKELLELLDEERIRGAGVLMSTHVLDTAEKICSSFILIHNGEMIAKGTLEHIRNICNSPNASLFECFHKLTLPEY